MNRRGFLKTLVASAVLAKTAALEAGGVRR